MSPITPSNLFSLAKADILKAHKWSAAYDRLSQKSERDDTAQRAKPADEITPLSPREKRPPQSLA